GSSAQYALAKIKNGTERQRVARKWGLWRACRSPVLIALVKRSAGRWRDLLNACGERHQKRPPITPKLLNPFTQNGAAIPNAPASTPPKAGPIARLMLIPTLSAESA